MKASQAFTSNIMPFLEWSSDHLPTDTCLTVKVPSIVWDIFQANNQLLVDHFLEGIFSRMGKSFVCKVKGRGDGECGIMVGCCTSTPFSNVQEVELVGHLRGFSNECLVCVVNLAAVTLENNGESTVGECFA